MFLAALGLALAASTATPAASHQVTVTHASGPVQVDYDARAVITHRQIGSAGPGGRAATLACRWSADLAVERVALTGAKSIARRSFSQRNVASGQRPGWCSGARAAIERDVAARMSDLSDHVALAARDDRPVLLADLDRITRAE